MVWKKIKSTEYVAKGENGSFVLEKRKGKWWPKYVSEYFKPFRMPPCQKATTAKDMCERNTYWED